MAMRNPSEKRERLPPDLSTDDPRNWNFDQVPDFELVACRYWEYARESAFIRDVKQRCNEIESRHLRRGEAWDRFVRDYNRIDSIGYESEVFLEGFFAEEIVLAACTHPKAEVISGSFPLPWQSLSPKEREYRSHIRNDVEIDDLKPIRRWGCLTTAELLLKKAQEYSDAHREAEDEVHRQNPGVGSGTLRRAGKLPPFHPEASVFWDEGSESTIFEIQWAHFTNDQISEAFRKWVKANRPNDIRKPNKQGHKHISYRVDLERLAIMRLLHRFATGQLRKKCPAAWNRYNTPNRRWQRDAEKARAWFHRLFPFLSANVNPISWPPKSYATRPA